MNRHHALIPLLVCLLLNTATAATAVSVTAASQAATPTVSTQDLKTLELQFQEKMLDLRKETLDSQQETIAWWLTLIGLLSLILPLAFYWRERSNMLENLQQAINEAKKHTEQAEKYLSEIKNQHQTAADYTAQIQQMRDYQSNSDNTAAQQAAVQAANDLQDNEQIPLAERLRAHAIVLSEQAQSYTEHEQAFYAWQAVIQHSPHDAEAIFNAAYQAQKAYKQNNCFQPSIWFSHIEQGYSRVLELAPDNYQAAYNWGNALAHEARALAQNNRFDEAWDKWNQAYKQYSKALRIKTNYYEAANNWAIALHYEALALAQNKCFDEAWDKWNQAYQLYSKALGIKPNYQTTKNWVRSLENEYLARKQNQQGQTAQTKLKEAQALAESFIQNYPQHAAELAYNLACVYSLLGNRTDKVLEQLKLAATSSEPPSKTDIEQDEDFDGIRHSPAFQNWFKQTFPE